MNIEKLAIEHGAKINESQDVIFDTDFDKTGVMCLKAFAQSYASSLQSSEPVAYCNIEELRDCKIKLQSCNVWHKQYENCDTALFTYPPASVPLEKYNKLLNALKEILTGWNTGVIDAEEAMYKVEAEIKAIAEAEGKEG